ncbi:MAG: hydrogen gas-evolving membrane-bound hydrogenase subunit E [Lachnospiraceae bacterium]
MSRIRDDYEKTAWRKLVHFVNGDGKAEEAAGYEIETEKTAVRIREEFFVEAEWNKKKEAADTMISKYKEWPETKGVKYFGKLYQLLSVVICVTVIVFLLATVANLPEFGNPDNPANNEVSERYIEKGMEETGAVNIVAGMILDYRAFDTLGESHVLFIAACCVLILLRIDAKDGDVKARAEANDRIYEPKNDVILQRVARVLVPIVMLFGIYVVFNGHLSPGGGFSGGAIIGAGLILYLNAFGFKKTERFFTAKTFSVISVTALGFYALSKCYSFFTGANHLDSVISAGTPGRLLSAGLILPLNICVGMVVACTMYSFYALFRKGGM